MTIWSFALDGWRLITFLVSGVNEKTVSQTSLANC